MITAIGPKKIFNAKIFGLPVFLVIFVVSIYLIIYDALPQKAIIPILCAYTFSITIAIIFLMFVFQIIYIPNGVLIDDELKQLTLKYLTSKQKVISVSDITAYKQIRINTKAGPCYGVVIYLLKQKQALLSDLNLDGYAPVKQFLDDHRVDYLGEGGFSFLPYFMRQ